MTFSFNRLGNHGHLGNQMFQYAAIKSLSIKHNRDFMIPPKEVFGRYYYTTLRSNIDDCFNIDCHRAISNFPVHEERHFHFDQETFENPPKGDVDLLGFFQSDKWFKHIEDQVRKDFTFKSEYYDAASELKEQLSENSEMIGIHIRRTDFVTNSSHISQDMSYYERCLDDLPKTSKVLIFSDEPNWCKSQEIFSDDRFLVSDVVDPYIDLCLMTLCDYIITANSTYSWWGAYLSNAKKIFIPSLWNPDTNPIDSSDLYVDGWIKK
jgi:hypothetical protein